MCNTQQVELQTGQLSGLLRFENPKGGNNNMPDSLGALKIKVPC